LRDYLNAVDHGIARGSVSSNIHSPVNWLGQAGSPTGLQWRHDTGLHNEDQHVVAKKICHRLTELGHNEEFLKIRCNEEFLKNSLQTCRSNRTEQ